MSRELMNRMIALEERISALEEQVHNGETLVAEAVLQTLKEDVLVTQIIERTVAAIEAEWTGKFLPELRKTNRADLKEALALGGR